MQENEEVGNVGCSRDPNYLKQKYLQSGNKYFDAGRLNEAIMYRKAIDQDHSFAICRAFNPGLCSSRS